MRGRDVIPPATEVEVNRTTVSPCLPQQQTLFAIGYDRNPSPPSPPAPPHNATPTSRAAAESITNAAPTLRGRVYEAICRAGSRGLTRHEVAVATDIDLATVCPRVGELMRQGVIRVVGTRPSPAGRASGVLIALPACGGNPQ